MKKTLYLLGFSIALLFSINAYTGKVYEPRTGSKAPELRIPSSDSTELKLSDYRGRYVLLSFWSSSDASSRICVKDYEQSLSSVEEGKLKIVSMNFDRSATLFREIVRIDNMNEETQYHVEDSEASDIIRAFDLSDGFKSFLIDREGRIVAVNPSITAINELLFV
ncbi:MAG: redoxin domain-containing protein [Paramuribaculum sp.]|nr:redoxin domain-containing protein [Paramuribaculum sp.]